MTSSEIPARLVIEGREVSVATLDTINFQSLERNDQTEIDKLVRSCKKSGFFYLDLKEDEGYLASLQDLYGLAEDYFDQPENLKMKDFRASQDRGYKPGEAETFEISRDELVQQLITLPTPINRETKLVGDFISVSHRISMTLLSHLAQALNLPHLGDSHRDSVPSDCGLKLESVPLEERLEDVPPSEHTDSGSLTLLFCPQYTTEIWVPERQTWEFIVPKAGHSIVNVADSLQALSGGALNSNLHRVGQPVAGGGKRFCLLYYLRPGQRD